METLSNYVLFSEIVEHSRLSYATKSNHYKNKLTMGKFSFVKKSDLREEDKQSLEKFTDLSNLYPMSVLSALMGRDKDHLSHMMHSNKKRSNPKPIKTVKFGKKYRMVVLPLNFINQINKGLMPFFIDTNKERDYEKVYKEYNVIDFYEMKIGFY